MTLAARADTRSRDSARLRRRKKLSQSENRKEVMNRSAQVVYRAASDVAAKGAFFVVTLIAARRLSHEGFGVFSIGTTLGWMAAVASDFGIQMHLARSIAHGTERPADALAAWLRVRAI